MPFGHRCSAGLASVIVDRAQSDKAIVWSQLRLDYLAVAGLAIGRLSCSPLVGIDVKGARTRHKHSLLAPEPDHRHQDNVSHMSGFERGLRYLASKSALKH
jgi:hypothetical protein